MPVPEFTAAQPEVANWSEGTWVLSVPVQKFPTEDRNAQPAVEGCFAVPTSQGAE